MMPRGWFPLLCAALLTPAVAAVAPYQVDATAWQDERRTLPHLKDAAIGVPRQAGGVDLVQLATLRPGGNDNVAQYRSADGAIIGTVYLYRPGLPDPTLAAIATTEALGGIYGKKPTMMSLAPAGGVANAAYRAVFDDIVPMQAQGFSPGAKTSIAAFLQAGAWLVKLRVTGPANRRPEVLAAADAILAGLTFDREEKPAAVSPYALSECPPPNPLPAAVALPGDKQSSENALLAAAASGVVAMARDADGVRRLCVMYRNTGTGVRLALSATGGSTVSYVLLGDAGNVIRMLVLPPRSGAGGVVVGASRVGHTDLFGPFDRDPSVEQLIGLTEGRSEWLGPRLSAVSYQGRKSNISVFTEPAK